MNPHDSRITSLTIGAALIVAFGLGGCEPAQDEQPTAPGAATDPISQERVGLDADTVDTPGLVDEEGEPASFESLPARPVLLSFIYTRCPMKTMCPLITQKMAAVQDRVNDEGETQKAHFVAVSFDPEFDAPEVLRRYGERFRIDPRSWDFWTGDAETIQRLAERFAITTDESADGTIMHNMRTFLLGPGHEVQYVYRRSDWSVEEVSRLLRGLGEEGS